jgi:hypothetical protein
VTLRLSEPDAKAVESFSRRQITWDPAALVRIVTSERAVGMFTTPPLGVLVFAAVPLAEPNGEPLDRIVRLSEWADLLAAQPADHLDVGALAEVVPTVAPGPSLLTLPPSDGWQIPIHAVSGDLVPLVQKATEEFETRSAGQPPIVQQNVADDIWERPVWAALPMRALHAARQLGMLPADRSRVSASTCGVWKRLSTPRGQVFVSATGPAARLSLRVLG